MALGGLRGISTGKGGAGFLHGGAQTKGWGVTEQAVALEQGSHTEDQDMVLKLSPEQFLDWKYEQDMSKVGPGSIVGYIPTPIKGVMYLVLASLSPVLLDAAFSIAW